MTTTTFFAFAGKSGQFRTYTTCLPASELGCAFEKYFANNNASVSPHERAQRLIDMAHVRRIEQYLDRPVRAFGSPVATATVVSAEPTAVEGVVMLTVNNDDNYLVDGQKRVMSCINKQKAQPEFDDTIPLVFVETTDLRAKKQLFASINSTAARVSSSLNAIYDMQSALSAFIPETFPTGLLELEKATVAKTSPKLLTPGIAKEAIASLLGTPLKTLETLSLERLDAAWDNWAPYVDRLFDVYLRLADKAGGFPALRDESILPHNVGLLAVIRILPLLRRQGLAPSYLDKLIVLHDTGDTSRANEIWEGRCMSLGSIKKTSRSVESTAAMIATLLDVELDETLSLFI